MATTKKTRTARPKKFTFEPYKNVIVHASNIPAASKASTKRTLGATKSKPIDRAQLAKLGLKAVTLREVKPKDLFTLSPIEYPKENQVWIKGSYDRASKTFCVTNWGNVGRERFLKGDRVVYQGFYF